MLRLFHHLVMSQTLNIVAKSKNFLPYFADKMMPIFDLLKKGVAWKWDSEHEKVWQEGKTALQNAPILGHPEESLPYHLYTDASDLACGCTLQQVQKMKVTDLKGTKSYIVTRKAWDEGLEMPKLYNKLNTKMQHHSYKQEWASNLEESEIWVERVIGYYSPKFKGAETHYSATEQEVLATKEGLVKFQPFIEGERVALITDHAALQWAKTYENSNH